MTVEREQDSRAAGGRRQRLSSVALACSFLLTMAMGPAIYVAIVVDDEDAFVSVADQVAAHPVVRKQVANTVASVTVEALEADELLAEVLPGQLRTLSVPIARLAGEQLTNGAFQLLDTQVAVEARDTALREVHRQVTADREEVTIDLRAVLVRTSRELGGPTVGAGVAKLVAGSETGVFTIAEADSSTSRLLSFVRSVPSIGGLIALVAVVSMVVAVVIAPDRRRALVAVGVLTVAGALFSTMIVSALLYLAFGAVTNGSPLGQAVAEVVSVDFAAQQRGLMLNGVVLAAVGLLLGDRRAAVALRSLPRALWRRDAGTLRIAASVVADNPALARVGAWLTGVVTLISWPSPTTRVVVSLILMTLLAQGCISVITGIGVRPTEARRRLGIAEPPMPTDIAVVQRSGRVRANVLIIGVAVFLCWPGWDREVLGTVFVIVSLLQAFFDAPAARRAASADSDAVVHARVQPSRRRWSLAAIAMAVTLAAGVALTAGATDRAVASVGCNGHVELCDRSIDEVVFAGSHNAMSSNDLGWQLALQDGDMVAQLDHGVRALLIDALYWGEDGTVEGGDDPAAKALIEGALGDDVPRPGAWLCHGFCALGATDLTAGLADISVWLDEHPREVLMIVVQDEVSAADLTGAFDASGLRSQVHTHTPGTDFPTLGELIESDERVLVYAENGGSPDGWIQNAWADTFTETPFTFAVRSDFSCAANRGNSEHPLFLINHWLTTGLPDRDTASVVNSADALLERVRSCEAETGRLPTILAVDFVEAGDLVVVVDELNKVGAD